MPQAVKRARMSSVWKMLMPSWKKQWSASGTFSNAWWNSMSIKSVLKMGDPRLLEVARKVEKFNTPELEALICDMHETMEALDGAGLAAPQIGVSLQVVIFGVKRNPRYPDAEDVPYTVLINPVLTPLTKNLEQGWEGCLSVPGMRAMVPRFASVR